MKAQQHSFIIDKIGQESALIKRLDQRNLNPESIAKLRATILEQFSSRKFHEVNIRQICENARVSPKTIYKYFGNKEEMLYACIEQDFNELKICCDRSIQADRCVSDNLKNLTATWFDYFERNIVPARIIFLTIPVSYWLGTQMEGRRIINDLLLELIETGQASGEIWSGVSAKALEHMVIGGLRRNLVRWLLDEELDLEVIKHNSIAILMKLLQP